MSLPKEKRLFYVMYYLDMQVDNGGFHQYYYNTEGKFLDVTLEATREMKLKNMAKIIKKVNMYFTKKYGKNEEEYFKYTENELWKPDEEYYSLDDEKDFYQPVTRYIIENKEKFLTQE